MLCGYVLSDKETRYSTQIEQCGCVEGNRAELITQIESNPQFCRDQRAISYNYFVGTLKNDSIIYIKNSDNNILGACSIELGRWMIIYGICVPYDDSIKGIGTILLDKVKCIGELIKAYSITLSAKPSVSRFYKKNGFVTDEDDSDEDDSDEDDSDEDDYHIGINMIYKFEKTPATGGKRKTTSQKRKTTSQKRKTTSQKRKTTSQKRKTTSQKSKQKNKQRKITKKRNKKKYQKYHRS